MNFEYREITPRSEHSRNAVRCRALASHWSGGGGGSSSRGESQVPLFRRPDCGCADDAGCRGASLYGGPETGGFLAFGRSDLGLFRVVLGFAVFLPRTFVVLILAVL